MADVTEKHRRIIDFVWRAQYDGLRRAGRDKKYFRSAQGVPWYLINAFVGDFNSLAPDGPPLQVALDELVVREFLTRDECHIGMSDESFELDVPGRRVSISHTGFREDRPGRWSVVVDGAGCKEASTVASGAFVDWRTDRPIDHYGLTKLGLDLYNRRDCVESIAETVCMTGLQTSIWNALYKKKLTGKQIEEAIGVDASSSIRNAINVLRAGGHKITNKGGYYRPDAPPGENECN